MDVPYIEMPIAEVRAIVDARRAEVQARLDAIEAHPLWPLADPEKAYGDNLTWWPEEMRQVDVPPELAEKWRAGKKKMEGWRGLILKSLKRSAWLPIGHDDKVDFLLIERAFKQAQSINLRAPRINGVPLIQAEDAARAMKVEINARALTALEMCRDFRKAKDALTSMTALTTSMDALEKQSYQTALFAEVEIQLLHGQPQGGGLGLGYDDYLAGILSEDTQKGRHSVLFSFAHNNERNAVAAYYASLARVNSPEAVAAVYSEVSKSGFALYALDWFMEGKETERREDMLKLWQRTEQTSREGIDLCGWVDGNPGINLILNDDGSVPEACVDTVAHEGRHKYQRKVLPKIEVAELSNEELAVNAFILMRLTEADAKIYGLWADVETRKGPQPDAAIIILYPMAVARHMADPLFHEDYDKPYMNQTFLTVLTEGRLREEVEKSPLTQIETLDKLLSFKEGSPGLLSEMSAQEQKEFRSQIIDGLCTVNPPAAVLERFYNATGRPQTPAQPGAAQAAVAGVAPAPV